MIGKVWFNVVLASGVHRVKFPSETGATMNLQTVRRSINEGTRFAQTV